MNKKIFKERNIFDKEIMQRGEREGIEIEKGAILTPAYLIEHEELFRKYCDFFTAYPDIFLDLIKPSDSTFTLFFIINALTALPDVSNINIIFVV